MNIKISLSVATVTRVLIVIAFFLAVQSITGRYVEDYAGDNASHLLLETVRLFNINRESSIPTWYASSLLLTAAGLLGIIAHSKFTNREPYRRHWLGLALIFVYLSIDEAATIHEIFTDPMQAMFNTSGPLYFAWMVVAIPLLLLFGVVYFRFWLNLPPRTRLLFMVAGVIYVGGAVGIEMVGSNKWYQDGGTSLLYSAIGTLEEFCEMLGVITLIYTLATYIVGPAYNIQLTVQAAEIQPQAQPVRVEKPRTYPAAGKAEGWMPVRWFNRLLAQVRTGQIRA